MTIALCLALVEIFMIFLLVPIKFAIKTHMSLSEGKIVAEIKVFGVSLVRLKCLLKGEIELYINGKRNAKSNGNISPNMLIALVRMLKSDITYSNVLAFVGGDAKNCAIVCTMLNLLPFSKTNAYFGTSKDKFDADMTFELALNLVEIASLAIGSNQE